MMQRNRSVWFFAGIAALAAMVAGGSNAQAGTVTIKGGIAPQGPGDPPYTYIFDVYLNNATINAYSGSGSAATTYSVDGLVGINTGSESVINDQYGMAPQVIWTPAPTSETATWNYYGYGSISTTGTLLLGRFEITTTTSYSSPPVPPGSMLTYTYLLDGVSGTGQITIVNGNPGVPEPSSIIMMLTGGCLLPSFAFRQAQRLRSRRVA